MSELLLHSRSFNGPEGARRPVCIILHGLLGSSRNWMSVAQKMAQHGTVYALDVRNHGQSPHSESMSYVDMAADVQYWMDCQRIDQAVILGHSMGGKIAMRLACTAPERVASLIVVDIAPRAYQPRWQREFAAMMSLPVETMASRAEAEQALVDSIRDWAFRKFLCTNLERTPEGRLRWSVNLPLLQASLPQLFEQVPNDGEEFARRALFVRGAESAFVNESDEPLIRHCFPNAEIRVVEGAGHNVHFDQPQGFLQALKGYWPQ